MHAWRIVDLRAYLAKKNHGYSIPAQSYDFCPHLIQLDILDFTLSHILPDATPGIIHPLSKIAVPFEPMMQFFCIV